METTNDRPEGLEGAGPPQIETKPGGQEEEEPKPDEELKEKIDNEVSEEFPDSFHFATIYFMTEDVTWKALVYLFVSFAIIFLQLFALLGFQIRNQYTFCQADSDCQGNGLAYGLYCETSEGICQGIDQYRQCSSGSDCNTNNFICSTEAQQFCTFNTSRKCTSSSDCMDPMYCGSKGYCVNYYQELTKTCDSAADCSNSSVFSQFLDCNYPYYGLTSDQIDSQNFTQMYCQDQVMTSNFWNYAWCSQNQTCAPWQYCSTDYYGFSICKSFDGGQCTMNSDCQNKQAPGFQANLSVSSQYYCGYNKESATQGICYFVGPEACQSDSDCLQSGWSCNISWTVYGSKFGYCYNTQAGQSTNYCQAGSSLLGVDKGALVFVSIVITVNVAKDLREAIVSDIGLDKRKRKMQLMEAISWKILLRHVKPPEHTSYTKALFGAAALGFLSLLLFVRKYVFIPMVMAVTASVMGTGTVSATTIILNGVAVFFVVDVDNLFYEFFHTKDQMEMLEEIGSVRLNHRENRYLRFIALYSAVLMTTALIVIVMNQGAVLSAFRQCDDPNGVFRAGGLFVIAFLFLSYFLGEISVPISEFLVPPADQKKEDVGNLSVWAQAAAHAKLELKSQLLAILIIIIQGVLGGLFFWGVVVGFYHNYLGWKVDMYNSTDNYASIVPNFLMHYWDYLTNYFNEIAGTVPTYPLMCYWDWIVPDACWE